MTTTTRAYRQIKVSGDWLENDDGTYEAFTVYVAVDEQGDYHRWNGFVSSPLFTFPEAQRLAAWIDAASGPDTAFDRIVVEEEEGGWQNVTHVPSDPGVYGDEDEPYDGHVNPYVHGLVEGEIVYDLGLGWTWYEEEA